MPNFASINARQIADLQDMLFRVSYDALPWMTVDGTMRRNNNDLKDQLPFQSTIWGPEGRLIFHDLSFYRRASLEVGYRHRIIDGSASVIPATGLVTNCATHTGGANNCMAIPPGSPNPVQLTISWNVLGGFNAPQLTWSWTSTGLVSITGSASNPLALSGGSYPSLTFAINSATAQDGLVAAEFDVAITNGVNSATSRFPFFFDVSTSQGFCGAASRVRGSNQVRGSWTRGLPSLAGVNSLGSRISTATPAGTVDLHLSASDVSFTPSLPKAGDTVQVRFRVRNDGSADAKGVPIALHVNGVTVASDTFHVGAGRSTLAGLQWNSAAVPLAAATRSAAVRPQRLRARTADGPVTDVAADAMDRPAGLIRVAAVLVIDPQHTVQQKTTIDKSAALAHFTMRGADNASGGATPGLPQRVLLEIQEGACAGLRLATGGVGPCGTADLELTIADIAKGTYTLNSDAGVADLGAAFAGAALGGARFSSELAAAAGHSHGVQLSGGRTARIMVDSIRNPNQLDAATRAVFRNSAIRVMRSLGSDSGPSAPVNLPAACAAPRQCLCN